MGFSNSKILINNRNKEGNKNKVITHGILCNKITNEIIYEGELVDGKCEGKGKYIFETGDYYIGEFKNGLREGKGFQYYKNKNYQYEGMWKDDKRNGHGKYYYENGDYFIGFWKDNKKVGKGELYDKNGEINIGGDVDHINTEEEKNYSINFKDLVTK